MFFLLYLCIQTKCIHNVHVTIFLMFWKNYHLNYFGKRIKLELKDFSRNLKKFIERKMNWILNWKSLKGIDPSPV